MDWLKGSRLQELRDRYRWEATPESNELQDQELLFFWNQGNQRMPLPPTRSATYKYDVMSMKKWWQAFCTILESDWKSLLLTLTYNNKGLALSFIRQIYRRRLGSN